MRMKKFINLYMCMLYFNFRKVDIKLLVDVIPFGKKWISVVSKNETIITNN